MSIYKKSPATRKFPTLPRPPTPTSKTRSVFSIKTSLWFYEYSGFHAAWFWISRHDFVSAAK